MIQTVSPLSVPAQKASTVGQGKRFLGDMVDCGPVPSLAAGTPLISSWQAGDRWCHCPQKPCRPSVGRLVTGQAPKGPWLLYGRGSSDSGWGSSHQGGPGHALCPPQG